MSVITTVKEYLRTTDAATVGDEGEESAGAHWCHDCGERIRDVEVGGDSTPDCPDCGDSMEFERSPDSAGCAC